MLRRPPRGDASFGELSFVIIKIVLLLRQVITYFQDSYVLIWWEIKSIHSQLSTLIYNSDQKQQ